MASLDWRKSSRSPTNKCVELAHAVDAGPLVLVRDSKNVDGPILCFSRRSFSSFLKTV